MPTRPSAPSAASRAAGLAVLRDEAGLCVCGNLRMAARVVSTLYDAALRPAGLEANQMFMLWVCHDAGELAGGDLARRVGMDPSTASRNLRVLEGMGYVACSASPDDGRERVVRLTPKGRTALLRALPRWQAVQREVLARTAELGDLVQLGRKLRKAARILQAASPAAPPRAQARRAKPRDAS